MITIHIVDEMLNYYSFLGGVLEETENGYCYVFPKWQSKVRFWGNLYSFSVADADFVYPHDTIIRSQFRERYIGIGISEQGLVEAYTQKDQMFHLGQGVNAFVSDSPVPFFMKVTGGQRLKFQGLYFHQAFFAENNISFYDSFWRDAKDTIHGKSLNMPELVSIYRRIKQCRLTGLAFDTYLHGLGMEAAAYLFDIVRQMSSHPPVYLDEAECRAVEEAKSIIHSRLKNLPSIVEICREVGTNKNKLQKGFRLIEGKSIAEYIHSPNGPCARSLREK